MYYPEAIYKLRLSQNREKKVKSKAHLTSGQHLSVFKPESWDRMLLKYRQGRFAD